jgi:short-subunit dehydrogenase
MIDSKKYGPWAVITGASAGLGEEFGKQLAPSGLNLFLVARRLDRLETLAEQLRKAHGIEVRCLALDLSADGSDALLDERTADLDVGLFVDNAGFGSMGKFLEQDRQRLAQMVKLNCLTAMLLAHRFGNRLAARGRGGLIIVASLAGYQATPHMSCYGATKAFDLLLGEGIADEMRHTGVDVLVLNPGSTSTEFGEVAGSRGGGGMRAGVVVAAALRALGRTNNVVTGFHNKFAAFLGRLFPRSFVTRMSGLTLKKMLPRGDG